MKRFLPICLALAAPVLVHATSYTFTDTSAVDTKGVQTSGGDGTSSTFNSLTHGTAYTWGFTSASMGGSSLSGLEAAVHAGTTAVTGATLTISGISDWTSESNDVLYVDLLNGLATGAHSTTYITTPTTSDTYYGADPFNPNSTTALVKRTGTNSSNYAYTYLNNNQGQNPLTAARKSAGYETYNTLLNSVSGHVQYYGAQTGSLIQGDVYNANGKTNTLSDGTFTADDTTKAFSITITLSAANVALLQSYLDDDFKAGSSTLGLGFGPDCHFSDLGISLCITTGAGKGGGGGGGGGGGSGVPDTTSALALFALGLAAVVFGRRRLA